MAATRTPKTPTTEITTRTLLARTVGCSVLYHVAYKHTNTRKSFMKKEQIIMEKVRYIGKSSDW
jgi:hypothetical protein